MIVAFLGHALSFYETIINVDDNTLHNIRLNYKSALALTSLKSFDSQSQKSLVFEGFIIYSILVLESILGMSSSFYVEH